MSKWASLVCGALIGVALGTLLNACADSGRGPTAPSALRTSLPAVLAQTVSWQCGGRLVSGGEGWSFPAAQGCPAMRVLAQSTSVASGLVTIAPTVLRSTVTGSNVRLQWEMAPDGVTKVPGRGRLRPALANLATLLTPTASTVLDVSNVPDGSYYVRVRGVGADNIPWTTVERNHRHRGDGPDWRRSWDTYRVDPAGERQPGHLDLDRPTGQSTIVVPD